MCGEEAGAIGLIIKRSGVFVLQVSIMLSSCGQLTGDIPETLQVMVSTEEEAFSRLVQVTRDTESNNLINTPTFTITQATIDITAAPSPDKLTDIPELEQSKAATPSYSTTRWSPFSTDLSECSEGDSALNSLPINLDAGYEILPMGKIMGSSHITPTDHWYLNIDIVDDRRRDVLAPASGYIVKLQRAQDEEGLGDYRMIIEHSCTLFSYYIHLREIDSVILSETGELTPGQNIQMRTPVVSGQPVGKVGPLLSYQRVNNKTNLDLAVVDTSIVLPGFIVPSHYEEAWKIHTVDPFDYYEEPIRTQLLERNLRDVEPYGGKIDFDLDGRLVGNWFLDGTETYFGRGVAGKSKSEWDDIYGRDVGECTTEYWNRVKMQSGGLVPCSTWLGHLTFAYDSLLPDQIKISMGVFWDYESGRTPWRVINNAPDPALIDVEAGMTKYEIFTDFEGRVESEPFDVVGTLLVQMIDDRTVRVEVFFGQVPEEIIGFSKESRVYRR